MLTVNGSHLKLIYVSYITSNKATAAATFDELIYDALPFTVVYLQHAIFPPLKEGHVISLCGPINALTAAEF